MSPHSFPFAVMLGALAALPSFGIDMSLPALNAMGSSLGVKAGEAGLSISLFMLGYAVAPPFCGPLSDRIGRRPIVLGAVAVFAAASFGCATSRSLPGLLAWRSAQGMGAGVATTLTFTIVNDLFDGAAGRAKISDIASLMLFVPMFAPAAGTAVLAIADWRAIFYLLAGGGLVLLCAVWLDLRETARLTRPARFNPAIMLQGHGLALRHPACLGYIIVNAAGFGAMFSYISGSSLLLIDALGLTRAEYSLVYATTFAGIMAGVILNGRLSTWGVAPAHPLRAGLALAFGSAALFMVAILAGWTGVPALIVILTPGTMGFGLIVPNAMHAAMQPLPNHAGAVSAMAAFVQVLAQSASSAAVVSFNDKDPGLSMAAAMIFWSAVALIAYLRLARPAEIISEQNALT
jgi:DHA1 family bicyclomycin/chloramphenicol resistance-like MFS transporter